MREIAAWLTYSDAERAVDHLSDQGFAVERTAVVADGIRFVEQVTGRLAYRESGIRAAVMGLVMGALFGFVFGLFNWIDPIVSALTLAVYGAVFGALVGLVLGLVLHALTGGRREDFSSVSHLQAERYQVLVEEPYADEAAALLERYAQTA
jgi:hypothetical protein